MALNPYNSYYPTYYQPQQMYQQQQMQMQMQPQQSMAMSGGITWVKDASEAASYPVAPNNAVALWDSSAPTIYLKQTDAAGKPTIKTYDLVERSNLPDKAEKAPTLNYVSKEELKPLDEAIKAIRSDIEKMSVDLYGIAGKKKPTNSKKMEEE